MTDPPIQATVPSVDWTALKARGRDWSLVFCMALGVYLLSAIISARLGLWLSLTLPGSTPVWAQVALAVVALDLAKVPALALGLWLLSRVSLLSPLDAAAGLVLTTYMLELIIALALAQGQALFLQPRVLACRVPVVALLVWLSWALGRRLRRGAEG